MVKQCEPVCGIAEIVLKVVSAAVSVERQSFVLQYRSPGGCIVAVRVSGRLGHNIIAAAVPRISSLAVPSIETLTLLANWQLNIISWS